MATNCLKKKLASAVSDKTLARENEIVLKVGGLKQVAVLTLFSRSDGYTNITIPEGVKKVSLDSKDGEKVSEISIDSWVEKKIYIHPGTYTVVIDNKDSLSTFYLDSTSSDQKEFMDISASIDCFDNCTKLNNLRIDSAKFYGDLADMGYGSPVLSGINLNSLVYGEMVDVCKNYILNNSTKSGNVQYNIGQTFTIEGVKLPGQRIVVVTYRQVGFTIDASNIGLDTITYTYSTGEGWIKS